MGLYTLSKLSSSHHDRCPSRNDVHMWVVTTLDPTFRLRYFLCNYKVFSSHWYFYYFSTSMSFMVLPVLTLQLFIYSHTWQYYFTFWQDWELQESSILIKPHRNLKKQLNKENIYRIREYVVLSAKHWRFSDLFTVQSVKYA